MRITQVRQDVIEQIAAETRSCIYASQSLAIVGSVSSRLHRCPGALQEQPVLWIHKPGFPGRITKKLCVELFHGLQNRRSLHKVRILIYGRRNPESCKL